MDLGLESPTIALVQVHTMYIDRKLGKIFQDSR